ncbi:MAG TPA: hypothetical protein VK586_05940 [Streptosporangiaceae bacterium]|nr:hypothetical protein [Streptosporangiaceae bacterium]
MTTPAQPAIQSWTTARRRIEEHPPSTSDGGRLGRHVHHDSRSLWYAYQRTAPALVSVLHARNIPILDQGDVGSCTGNGEVGCLGTDPLWGALPGHPVLNEAEALRLYSAAEVIDGDGPYPPNDNGSSGLSAAKAAKNAGLIAGYVHCLSLADVLDALQSGPVSIGINWYDSFDNVPASGLLAISKGAQVRGGHEPMLRGVDVNAQTVFGDNSWGTSWGVKGSFSMGWATLERLLSEDGDGTVSVPLSQPAPVPVPPAPVPVPPAPGPDTDPADLGLMDAGDPWAAEHHVGANGRMQRAYLAWRKVKEG